MLRTNLLRMQLTRYFASKVPKTYCFEEIMKLVKEPRPSKILIDVREASELKQFKLPNSINLPLITYPGALSLAPEEFKDIFGIDKPLKDKELIFFCKSGVRAQAAQELANSYGYMNTGVWPGSINEWVSKTREKAHLRTQVSSK